MPRTVIIYGAGGQGRVVLDILRSLDDVRVVGFLDSNKGLHGSTVDGLPVIGDINRISSLVLEYPNIAAIVAIGDNKVRRRIAQQLRKQHILLINAIHPRAFVSPSAIVGSNVTVAPGAIICAHARIGDDVIINTGAIVEHENCIGNGVHIAPGAKLAGRVTVGECAFVGIGATVIGNLSIGPSAVVGAGAVVLHNVEPFTIVVGIPARPIEKPVTRG